MRRYFRVLTLIGIVAGAASARAFLGFGSKKADPSPSPSPSPVPLPSSAPASSPSPTPIVVDSKPAPPSVPVKLPSAESIAAQSKRDFERAQSLMEQGQEAQALLSLTDFLRRYPDHKLAGDVQFMVGEVYFRQRKFAEAIAEYAKVWKLSGGKSVKIPYAILRKGESFNKLGENVKAQIEWNALLRRYPDSPAAAQARVLLKGLP